MAEKFEADFEKELIEIARNTNILICKNIIKNHLKELVEQDYYETDILEDKNLINSLAESYYENLKDMLFESPYEKEHLYSSRAMEKAFVDNCELL